MNGYRKTPFRGSHWPTLIVSLLSQVLVTAFLLAAVCSYNKSITIFHTVDSFKLRDSLVYAPASVFSTDSTEMNMELENIRATPGVLDANLISTYAIEFNSLIVPPVFLIQYDDSLIRDVQYKLSEGVYPSVNQKNAILLPYVLRPFFRVGEEIEGYTKDCDDSLGDPLIPISVTVFGFLAPQPLLDPRSGADGLADLFTSQPNAALNDIPIFHGVTYGLQDNDGNAITPQTEGPYIIRSDGSVSEQALKNNLMEVLTTPSRLYSGNEMVEEYIDENRRELSITISLMITSFILSFSILTASTLLELVYRKKEMAVLYLCGASWSRCLWITLARQIVPILIALPIGFFLYILSKSIGPFTVIFPQVEPQDIITVLIIEFLFFSVTVLPFRFLPKFKTPHELFRKD